MNQKFKIQIAVVVLLFTFDSRLDAAGANLIIRNTANGFVISGSQMVGPIVTATGTITTNNPWANFQLAF